MTAETCLAGWRRGVALLLAAACLIAVGSLAAWSAAPTVTITWYGHSMFKLEFEGGPTVLTDPFEPGVWGIAYPVSPIEGVDVVTVSHEHEDHNHTPSALGEPMVLRGMSPGSGPRAIDEEIDGVRFYTVGTCHVPETTCSPPDANGAFVIEGYGLRIVHLGDLGHVLTSAQSAAIGTVDVLFVPVGGAGPTIGAAGANTVIAQLGPSVIIGMHYETPALGWGLDTIDPFLAGKTVIEVATRSLAVHVDGLPEEPTVFVMRYE